MIPKRMMFYWCGERMSWLRYSLLAIFKKLNPDWDTVLYTAPVATTEETYRDKYYQDFLVYHGEDWLPKVQDLGIEVKEHKIGYGFDETLNPVFKADLSRWQLLMTDGGFYSDTDILYTKPMKNYMPDKKRQGIDLVLFLDPYILIGFLASSPNNRFFRDVFKQASKSVDPEIYESAGAMAIRDIFGTHAFIKQMKKQYPNQRVDYLSHPIVYPITYKQHRLMFGPVARPIIDMVEGSKTIGIHLFGGTKPFSQYNNKVNPDNYRGIDNLISYYLGKML